MLFAATNRGGQAHLTGELFRERAKANISFVHAAGATVSINDVTVTEGDAGTSQVVLRVTLHGANGGEVAVDYATGDGEAAAGDDYDSVSGRLVFS